MKKAIALLVGTVMAMSLVACSSKESSTGSDVNAPAGDPDTGRPSLDSGRTSGDVRIPNPFSEYGSMEEASENAGFSFDVPDSIDGYARRIIRVMADEDGGAMIEVIYQNEIDGNENTGSRDEIRMRKASGDEDISGDYTEYSEISTITVENARVTIKGENGRANLAIWTDGGYAYSIGAYSEFGISTEEMSGFIATVR